MINITSKFEMKHFETQIRDFSQQFTDQIKCLDAKVSVDNSILTNILDLYKRRAVIEQEYSDNLLKLSTSITQKNNADNQKRLKWKNYSPAVILNSFLVSTQYTAKAHKNLSDIYGKQITQRVLDMQEDCVRLNKKSIDILQKHHLEIIRSLNQLLVKQKLYVKTFNEADEARKRADRAIEQLDREVVRCQDKKKELDKNPRIKRLKDEYTERHNQLKSKQGDSTTARNKYIIHLLSLKETIDHFYSNELKQIIECAEYGFHNNLTRLTMNHTSCEDALITVHESINKLFTDTIDKIDANSDTQVFIEAHKATLSLKENLHFTPAKDDTINIVIKSREAVENCLQNMYVRFDTEMIDITKRVNEDKEKIDSLSKNLNELINQNDFDVVDYICHQSQPDNVSIRERTTSLPRNGASENMYTSLQKIVKENKLKAESNYFQAMEMYLTNEINKVNMGTKLKSVKNALNDKEDESECHRFSTNIQSSTAVIIGMKSKLFGGDLCKYCKETNENVPLVVRSCIRLISLYGMPNMGVFRVPGSQTEVQTFKTQFELGNDPLKELKGTMNDVNLAASILKLYFRELEPPIFDEDLFNKIVTNYQSVNRNEESVVSFMKDLILSLHSPAYDTLNYLLSFIRHLAEFSSENCMDIPNLAIIFGPCLMPIPEDKSSQLFQYQSIVNHVAQCLISHNETIFTKESKGPLYNRDQTNTTKHDTNCKEFRNSNEIEKMKFFDNSLTGSSEEVRKKTKSDVNNLKRNETVRYIRSNPEDNATRIRRNSDSSKTFDILAVAVADYNAKGDQELSFINGDTFLLKKKINENWWSGYIVKSPDQNTAIQNGLIPNLFISIYNQNGSLSDTKTETLDSKEGDLSSPESQKLSAKSKHSSHKRSMASIDSDNELDLSQDDNRSLSRSLENTADLSEFGESKSFGSFENIVDDDEDQILIPSEDDNADADKFSLENKNVDESEIGQSHETEVKFRVSRSSTTMSSDLPEAPDTLDEDYQQTMQGLKKIEEMNVKKHRNTVHIDKSVLESKFISPWTTGSLKILDVNLAQSRLLDSQDSLKLSSEFKMKKPGNVSSLATSFEMNQSPTLTHRNPLEISNSLSRNRTINEENQMIPPKIYPKPNFKK